MHTAIPLGIAGLLAVGISIIGAFYILSPERIMGGFGLKMPAPDTDTRAWLRLKGIRDIGSGLVVLTLMRTTDPRTVGIALLALSFIAFGDMCNVLLSGGSKSTAFSVHGVTCTVMIVVGLFLVHVL
ncbi:MAG: DUF4267 domain-containing protein [Acidobacteria bacterium]|nr:DUF4267 domain-containing protein [Acidobacteriota bacterium]